MLHSAKQAPATLVNLVRPSKKNMQLQQTDTFKPDQPIAAKPHMAACRKPAQVRVPALHVTHMQLPGSHNFNEMQESLQVGTFSTAFFLEANAKYLVLQLASGSGH